ncbi:hypothetical protein [Mycolicibacterium sarraceniae]|uniref:Uncharacterized protein n=1 Tax=Mycolicibacterium sarraceniae TaxID=1534348 RepID=A0A7I7SXJ8_9MYCO|nr:hypothetical protein MSAR_44660 [Mycolicibacterium sarraceniae]
MPLDTKIAIKLPGVQLDGNAGFDSAAVIKLFGTGNTDTDADADFAEAGPLTRTPDPAPVPVAVAVAVAVDEGAKPSEETAERATTDDALPLPAGAPPRAAPADR